jgi:hypothetical protein
MVSDSTINVIVSNLHLNRDLDWLKREFSEAIAGSTGDFCVDLGAALFALNILAVEARYGKGEAAKFRPLDYRFRLEPASARRVYDEIKTLDYQCSEGDVPQTALFKLLVQLKAAVADDVIEQTAATRWKSAKRTRKKRRQVMGWLYGWKSREELTAHLLNEPTTYTTLAHRRTSEGGESVLWAVHEVAAGREKAGTKFLVCYLIGHDRRDGTFGYKDLGEECGPCFYSCPVKFLDMVPEPDGEYAHGWREKVRQFHAQAAARRQFIRTLKVGDTVNLREGCTPSSIKVTSLKPLRGTGANGVTYRVSERYIAA